MPRVLLASLLIGLLVLGWSGGVRADITSNLVAHWKFSEGTSTTTADSAGSNTGTLSGSTLPSWTSSCQLNNCLTFNGTTAYVTVPDDASLDVGTGDFTLSAWVNPSAVDSAYHFILEKGNSGQTLPSYQLMISSNNLYRFTYEYSGGSVSAFSNASATASTWTLIVGVAARSGNTTLYRNTTAQNSPPASNATTLDNTHPVQIGARLNGSGRELFWAGMIDDVRIYKRALASGDVTELFNATEASATVKKRPLYLGQLPLSERIRVYADLARAPRARLVAWLWAAVGLSGHH